MSLRIRRVSFADDREEMLGLLNRNFEPGQERAFDWRHINNPVGEAWSWLAYDHKGNAVATTSVFPRRMFVSGKTVLCGQVGGFAVDAAHRSLGPAVLLQRTTFEPVNSGAISFCYDCPPHDRGMSTFVRMGMHSNCEIARYALLLRSDEFLEKRLGRAIWTRPLVAVANISVRMRIPSRPMAGLEISESKLAFGDEFSHLDTRVPSLNVIRARRSAELLDWRYTQNPGTTPRMLVARRGGELMGFLTFWLCGARAYLGDLFGVQLMKTGPALLEAAVELCRKAKISSVHGFCSNDSELRPLFQAVGFRQREREARVVAYEKQSELNHGLRWAFSQVELVV